MTANDPKPASPPDPTPGKDHYYAVEPNQMTYTDGQGMLRTKHIPMNKSQEARQFFLNKNWDALAQFPEWTGTLEQRYSEKDYVKMPKGQLGQNYLVPRQ